MSECVSAQFWCIIENKNTTKVVSCFPLKNGYALRESNIFAPYHITGSGTTTRKKYIKGQNMYQSCLL